MATRRGCLLQVLFCKGAPEVVLERSTTVLCNEGSGSVQALTAEMRRDFSSQFTRYGQQQALRCLALAMKPLPPQQQSITPADESRLIFLGLVGMLDPPREEVKAAVETCRSAGIRVIVVTGDNKATSEAVCRKIGILDPVEPDAVADVSGTIAASGKSLTASELEQLSPQDQATALQQLALFCRLGLSRS